MEQCLLLLCQYPSSSLQAWICFLIVPIHCYKPFHLECLLKSSPFYKTQHKHRLLHKAFFSYFTRIRPLPHPLQCSQSMLTSPQVCSQLSTALLYVSNRGLLTSGLHEASKAQNKTVIIRKANEALTGFKFTSLCYMDHD